MSEAAERHLSLKSNTIRAGVAFFVVALTIALMGMILAGSASAGTITKLVDKASPNLQKTCTTVTPVNK